MFRLHIIIGLSFCILSCSESAPSAKIDASVVVVDEAGNPIQGADVIPVTASMSGGKIKTNDKGEVELSSMIQQIEWVTVSKRGYQEIVQAQYAGLHKPVRVVLKKADPLRKIGDDKEVADDIDPFADPHEPKDKPSNQ